MFMSMKRFILLAICLFSFSFTYANEVVRVRKAVGRWEVSDDITPKQAEEKAESGKAVLEAVKEALGEQVKEVRVSSILKSAACCMSADGPVTLEMERYLNKIEGGEKMKAVLAPGGGWTARIAHPASWSEKLKFWK